MLHLHRASAQRLPPMVCRVPGAQPPFYVCGREHQCWKKVLGYNHGNGKPAQSCLCPHGKGLSAPAVCQRGSDVAVICFGDKGVFHPPALLSMGPLKHWGRNSVPDFHLGCGLSWKALARSTQVLKFAFPERTAAAEGVAVPSYRPALHQGLPVPGLIQLKCCSLNRIGPSALPELFLEGQVFTRK